MSTLESAIVFSLILVMLSFMIAGPEAIILDSFDCAKDGGNELFYMEQDKEVMEKNITEFSETNGISSGLVLSILNEYFVDDRSITKNKIRERLADMKLPLLKQTKLINAILIFVREMYDKFTAEGV